jgi:arsenite methyltransferase
MSETEHPGTPATSYGVDAPRVLIGLGAAGGLLMAVALTLAILDRWPATGLLVLLSSISFLGSAAVYLHTTLRGKFQVWSELLEGLDLDGDEAVVDLGCGRGAVLVAAARRVPRGRVTGVDLWRSVDQSGNTPEATLVNAIDVSDRMELRIADLTALPFPDRSFDIALSALAIHNISPKSGRKQAVHEAARVVRPGGRLVLADILHTADYVRWLTEDGLVDVSQHSLGWRYW